MVRKINSLGVAYFQCGICKFSYKTEQKAQKCENWCRENKSCNIEITKDAVKIVEK